ncbi:MAG: hypothetical protein LUE29_12620 [Lachnospiraceae bacterium]|nr:hypothetical protein [Lachnospiraceae bacterium]
MKKRIKVIVTLCIALCMLVTLVSPMQTNADVPYKTYTQNGYGELVATQTAYISEKTLTKLGDYELGSAQDMKILNNVAYVVDAGTSDGSITPKIIVYDINKDTVLLEFEENLQAPSGIYVMDDGTMYVADANYYSTNNGAIVVFDSEGNKIAEYGKPDSPLYGTGVFAPTKVAVADGGTMYIVCSGNTNGLAQISETDGGTFLGYFGTNSTDLSLYYKFLKMVLSDEAADRWITATPLAINNTAIDDKGLIYTITAADDVPVKKLNIAGTNLIDMDIPASGAAAVAVGAYENIYVASQYFIYEYTKEGTLLFMFGGADTGIYRKGLFGNIVAIDVDSNDKIYTLDGTANEIQVFTTTEFSELVHESLTLYQKGQYTASKEPLTKIIPMNALFDYANLAMAEALYQEGDYENAMTYYRLAKEVDGYSDSFWEVRNVWMTNYIAPAVIVIVVLYILYRVIKNFDKKKGILNPVRRVTSVVTKRKTWQLCTYMFTYMRHPVEGAYQVKRKGKQSYLSCAILMVIMIVYNVVSKYFCGFIVKSVKDGYYAIPQDCLIVIFGFLAAAAVTYLVTCISDGEGKFKDTLQGYIYSFGPYFAIQPFIYLFGLVVTNNEIFIIEFANIIMIAWVVILVFISVMEINNYSFKETVKVILLTVFAAFIFVVAAFIMYVLAMQVVEFVSSVYGEVVYRIGS